jgi:hypothetical protein
MEFLKKLGGAIASAVVRPGPIRNAIAILAVLVISIGLAIVNARLGLDHFVAVGSPTIRSLWLPLLFLLVCLIAWLNWRLWRLWTAEHDSTVFSEIDRAWREARAAMRRAAVELGDLPVFLVLGQPVGGNQSLFHASGMPLAVSDVPRRPDAPIHVFATYEAIFVTCPGLSALGHLATSRVGIGDADDGMAPASSMQPRSEREASGGVPAPTAGAPATGIEPTADSPIATRTAGGVERVAGSIGTPTRPAPRTRSLDILLSQTSEMEALTRKLKHFCKLLLGDRRPYCPINGILLLLPFAATNSESEARQTGTACHLDLTVIRGSTLVNCPVFALMCDVETVPHSDRLLEEFSEEQRLQLMGRPFPLVPDLQVSERVRMVESGSDWIGHAAFMPMLYRLMRFSTRNDGLLENVKDNAKLFRFFAEMHGRSRRLGRLLGRLVSLDTRGQVMLGGCFVACTGRDPKREQAFVGGVLQLLIDNQNFVSWTPDALRQEANYHRLSTLGNIAIASLLIVGLALIVGLWRS